MEEITARLILRRRHRLIFRERSGRASENLDFRPESFRPMERRLNG